MQPHAQPRIDDWGVALASLAALCCKPISQLKIGPAAWRGTPLRSGKGERAAVVCCGTKLDVHTLTFLSASQKLCPTAAAAMCKAQGVGGWRRWRGSCRNPSNVIYLAACTGIAPSSLLAMEDRRVGGCEEIFQVARNESFEKKKPEVAHTLSLQNYR